MHWHKLSSILFVVILCCSVGCGDYSGKTFSGSQVRSAQRVDYGTVVSVHEVVIAEDSPAVAGTIGGGILGGILGNAVGGGRGNTIATVIGAGAGALAGNAAQKELSKQKGLEIEVTLDSGETFSIVQAADQVFTPGQRVRVLRGSDGSARVAVE